MSNNTKLDSRRFGGFDYIKIIILGFGIYAFWGGLQSTVLPLRLLDFVPEKLKNSYLGYLTFAGLILAMVIQPVVSAISDRSTFKWGRRRPYMLVGTILTILFLPGIGLWGSYATILITFCLLQLSLNSAQGPYQGFIPDLVPESKRGTASGIKILELLGGITLVRFIAYFMDHYSANGESSWLWAALGTLASILLVSMLATVLLVKERPGTGGSRVPLLLGLRESFRINIKGNRNFIWFLVSRMLMTVPITAIQTFALYYVMDVVALPNPASVTADLWIVVGISVIIVGIITGRFSDRVGRKPLILVSGVIGALGMVFLYFSRTHMHLMLSGIVLGAATGAFVPASWALATDLLVKGEEAKYMALANLAWCAGSALSRLNGPVIDHFNRFGNRFILRERRNLKRAGQFLRTVSAPCSVSQAAFNTDVFIEPAVERSSEIGSGQQTREVFRLLMAGNTQLSHFYLCLSTAGTVKDIDSRWMSLGDVRDIRRLH